MQYKFTNQISQRLHYWNNNYNTRTSKKINNIHLNN